jgi:hypothetical protein
VEWELISDEEHRKRLDRAWLLREDKIKTRRTKRRIRVCDREVEAVRTLEWFERCNCIYSIDPEFAEPLY